jgi:hypothetical protein
MMGGERVHLQCGVAGERGRDARLVHTLLHPATTTIIAIIATIIIITNIIIIIIINTITILIIS